jgi:hypothetical protein
MRLLDDWLSSYLQYTDRDEPPVTYRTWTAISVIAAALQRKCSLNWGRHIVLYPNMYIVLVGPSGKCRKGTAMGPGYFFLRKLGVRMAAEAITREALIRELKEANDTAINAVTGMMYNSSSLTIYSQELTVFLGYNNGQLMSDLTDWYDCRDRWKYRTKHMGTDDIEGVWVNLIGATTPDLIQSTLPRDAIGGGLTSRIIFIFEPKKGRVISEPYNETAGDGELEDQLMRDLEAINAMSGEFQIDQTFKDLWKPWYEAQEGHPPFDDSRFAGYIERRPVHVLKLSMIMNASRGGDMELTEQDLGRAIQTLEIAERKMQHTFSGVGKNPIADTISKVIAMLAERKTLTMRDLLDTMSFDASRTDLNDAIAVVRERGLCDIRQDGHGNITMTYKERDDGEHAT